MKKVLALVTALVFVTLAMAVGASASVPDKPSEFAYAYDFDGSVLSNSTKTTIEQYGAALEEATGIQAIAVVVDFLDGEDPADYATDIINSWGVGQSGENNGVVVLLARGDRKIQIGTGTGVDRVMSGAKCGDLIDDNIDYFADNKFDKGMLNLYEDVCTYLARAKGKTLLPLFLRQKRFQQRLLRQLRQFLRQLTTREALICSSSSLGLSLFTSSSACFLTRSTPSRGGCLSYFFHGLALWPAAAVVLRAVRVPLMGGGFGGLAASAPSSDAAAAVTRVLSVRAVLSADSARGQLSRRRLRRRFRRRRQLRRRFFPRRRRRTAASERAEPRACPLKILLFFLAFTHKAEVRRRVSSNGGRAFVLYLSHTVKPCETVAVHV